MISRQPLQWLVIGGILLTALLIAVTTGPFCVQLPTGLHAGAAHCYLWVTPASSPDAPPLALVSLPPDWNPDR